MFLRVGYPALSIDNKSKKSSKIGDAIYSLKLPESRQIWRRKSFGGETRLKKMSLARQIRNADSSLARCQRCDHGKKSAALRCGFANSSIAVRRR
jgi:hypothetical protein